MEQVSVRIENESRRRFLQGAAGLTLAVYLPGAAAAKKVVNGEAAVGAFEPNAFISIGDDNVVTVFSKHVEMGQGAYTGLATIVAEELDASWAQVRVQGAPADVKRYANLAFGMQGTGGSTAIANSWEQLRGAGATARAMLVSAAAEQWKVPAGQITVSDGVVSHAASKHKATFGQLAQAAAKQPVPEDVPLKDPKNFKLIGKHAPRKDSVDKITGKGVFTQDIHLPGMLTAVVAHPPRFGAKVKSFDAAKAKAVKGVVEVVQIPTGVAVLAKDTWSAKKGRDALTVEWDESSAYKASSADIMASYKKLAEKPGNIARNDGDVAQALSGAARKLSASYEFPYLAHAAMEPLNCVVQRTDSGAAMWNGEQFHTVDQGAVAKVLELKQEQVTVHSLYAGGSFGRRANPVSDYVVEAASIVKVLQNTAHAKAPVKLVWLREDDTRGGFYRPMYFHQIDAALDKSGNIVGWSHRIVGQSIAAGTPFEQAMVKNGVDHTSVEGAASLPYQIPNLRVDLHTPKDVGVPVLWWRSVGSTHTAYSTETFLDEVASAAKKDPVALRLELLGKHPRHAGVLKLAADKAGWGAPLAPGKEGEKRGRGVAVHESFKSFVAEIAEVTVKPDGSYSVDRVVCAVDCGVAVNPDVIKAQMEGGIGYALSALKYGAITLKDGAVEQSNFHDYQALRINEMPKVEVYIVPSGEKPTGVGEPGVPPLAPAVANAIFAATSQRVRNLPLGAQLQKA